MEQRPTPQEQHQAEDQAWARLMGGRQLGLDGPDDVRRHEELGPLYGSAEAALSEALFETLRAQEQAEGDPDESLTARAEALRDRVQAQEQALERSPEQGLDL